MNSSSAPDNNVSLRQRRYPTVVALTYVLWAARYRKHPKAPDWLLVSWVEQEITALEIAGRLKFGQGRPRPSRSTVLRILGDIRVGRYLRSPEFERSVIEFRTAYDRHAEFRMDLVEVDGTKVDKPMLQRWSIDFIAADEKGVPIEVEILSAKDRVTNVCPGTRVFAEAPDSLDVHKFLADMMLGRLARELGRVGKALEFRWDCGGVNAASVLEPSCDRARIGISVARRNRPYDKPFIEGFHYTLSTYVHFRSEDVRTIEQDGKVFRFVILATLRQRLDEGRIRFNLAKPQRPVDAPRRRDVWFARGNRAQDALFDEKTFLSHWRVEYRIKVVDGCAVLRW
jgi:hypothetical protein